MARSGGTLAALLPNVRSVAAIVLGRAMMLCMTMAMKRREKMQLTYAHCKQPWFDHDR
jgi:hypothetical protein